jgi:hypothetical protein
MRPALVALGLAVALVGSGCQYLLGYDPYALPEDWSEELPDPTPIATFESGSATIAIDGGPTITLPRLTIPGAMYESFGGHVTFTNDEGWYLQVMDMSTGAFGGMGPSAYVTVDRIVDGAHWSTIDTSRCIVDTETADETGLQGRATCKGLRWSDVLATDFYGLEPTYVEGEAPFDAEITFEAEPGSPQG